VRWWSLLTHWRRVVRGRRTSQFERIDPLRSRWLKCAPWFDPPSSWGRRLHQQPADLGSHGRQLTLKMRPLFLTSIDNQIEGRGFNTRGVGGNRTRFEVRWGAREIIWTPTIKVGSRSLIGFALAVTRSTGGMPEDHSSISYRKIAVSMG
jgi:hypothetical protein